MDESWFLVSGQASNPYNYTGMHLVSRRCRVTSSYAFAIRQCRRSYDVFGLFIRHVSAFVRPFV